MSLFLASAALDALPAFLAEVAAGPRTVFVPTEANGLPDRDELVRVSRRPLVEAGLDITEMDLGGLDRVALPANARCCAVPGGRVRHAVPRSAAQRPVPRGWRRSRRAHPRGLRHPAACRADAGDALDAVRVALARSRAQSLAHDLTP